MPRTRRAGREGSIISGGPEGSSKISAQDRVSGEGKSKLRPNSMVTV